MAINWRFSSNNFYQQVRMTLVKMAQQIGVKVKEINLNEQLEFKSKLSLNADTKIISDVALLEKKANQPDRLAIEVTNDGLFGVLGSLPSGYSEFFLHRKHRYADEAGKAFLDIFNHHLYTFFYKTWRKNNYYAQAEVSEDYPFVIPFEALAGVLLEQSPQKIHPQLLPLLISPVRTLVNLERVLGYLFAITVNIIPFSGNWVKAPQDWQVALGAGTHRLSDTPILGKFFLEHQTTFRIELGPIPVLRLRDFLENGSNYQCIIEYIKSYIGNSLSFFIELIVDIGTLFDCRSPYGYLGIDACLGGEGKRLTRIKLPIHSIFNQ